MGGGAAMRTAAKVAGIRGMNAPVASTALMAARPVSTVISSSNIPVASENEEVAPAVQRPSWEIDDWEFVGREDESMPRVVFGCAPSLQEAKVATTQLKDALETAYMSQSTFSANTSSHTTAQELGLPLPSKSETKACDSSDTTIPVPKHAMQAFKFLSETPAAQTVVASIASDPQVWNAVLQNEALVDFLQTHKTNSDFSDQQFSRNFIKSSGLGEYTSSETVLGSGFDDFVQNIKQTVVDMMYGLSDYFQNLFRDPMEEKTSADGSARLSTMDKALGASLVGLAIMVIMVVALKRG